MNQEDIEMSKGGVKSSWDFLMAHLLLYMMFSVPTKIIALQVVDLFLLGTRVMCIANVQRRRLRLRTKWLCRRM
jgi:hypothetical protein